MFENIIMENLRYKTTRYSKEILWWKHMKTEAVSVRQQSPISLDIAVLKPVMTSYGAVLRQEGLLDSRFYPLFGR